MQIQVKSTAGITVMPITTRLLAERKVFIEGEINNESACSFFKEIMFLCCEDEDKDINIYINSPGGELNAGLLMYDVIQGCKAKLKMFCMGQVYSMAAVLFASGKDGRYMFPNSRLMLHEPLLGKSVSGSSSSIKSISDSLLKTREKINQILAKHTKKSIAQVEKATCFDNYFSAQEAVDFGLCDEIIDFGKLTGGNIL